MGVGHPHGHLALLPDHRPFVTQKAQLPSWAGRCGTWCPCDGIQLGTDGVWAQGQEGPGQQHQGTGSPWAQTLFVGGLPVGGFSARIPAAMGDSGISGCARRLRLDRWPLGTLTWVVGVTPCFSGPLEKGLFFAGTGSCHSRQPGGCSAMHA